MRRVKKKRAVKWRRVLPELVGLPRMGQVGDLNRPRLWCVSMTFEIPQKAPSYLIRRIGRVERLIDHVDFCVREPRRMREVVEALEGLARRFGKLKADVPVKVGK